MNTSLLELAFDVLDARKPKKTPTISIPDIKKRVGDRSISYTARHRGQWFKPEYDLAEIQIASHTDSYLMRALSKKVNRFMIAGWEFHGRNPESVEYIRRRISEIELATDSPWPMLIRDTVMDLSRYNNCMWVKARNADASTGDKRVDLDGNELEPVAGYFILPFETLEFKTKPNGELKKLLQRMHQDTKEFFPRDLVHFYVNKSPGFAIATPEILPALDDIALLRRIEENVEELIETNLFPVYHYMIGTDELPERYDQGSGLKESDVVKRNLEYMPAGAIYVSDHRHKIEVLGSENKALRLDFYLTYFKNRALAGLGVSAVDMGEGDTANRSTAGTISKSLIQDVEALQVVMKTFIEFHVIRELLWEGGYDPLDDEERVEISFGVIDKEEQTRLENQVIQLAHGKMVTVTEARKALGKKAYTEEDYEDTYYKRFEEPLALLGNMGPGTAASETLGEHTASNVTPEAVNKETKFAEKQAKEAAKAKAATAKKAGAPKKKSSSTGSARSSASKSRPSNQTGTRSSPKFSKDLDVGSLETWFTDQGGDVKQWQTTKEAVTGFYSDQVDRLNELLEERVSRTNCSAEIVYNNLSYRLDNLYRQLDEMVAVAARKQ